MAKQSKQEIFLKQLQSEAQLQSKLSTSHVFPAQLDPVMTFVGNYPWQTLTVISAITAFFITVFTKL